ncbi:MAG: CvpA family protein [Lachnospiraceae bacterium]|nr:CvpA family protein [Lachnospiraceae bacterium]
MVSQEYLFYIIIALYVCVILGAMIRGFQKGFLNIIDAVLSMVAAAFTVLQILRAIEGWQDKEIPQLIRAVALLIVLGLLYRIFHMLFGAVHLLAKLPLLRETDKVLGIFAGAAEGIALVYALSKILQSVF